MAGEVNPVEFGRVLGHLESIQAEIRDIKTRTVFRLDDIERRVEALEKVDAGQGPYIDLIAKAVPVLCALGAAAWAGSKFLGV